MTAESFDAVLAEVRKIDWRLRDFADRLQSAHEAEVAERDARIADLQAALYRWVPHADHGRQAADDTMLLMGMTECSANEPGEAVRQRADRAVGLLRDYRMAPKFSHDHAAIKRTVALEDEINAFLSEQAGERENATKDSAHED